MITRTWATGDVVDVALPMAVVREATPDSATTQAVKYGPIVLAGAYGSTNLSALPTLTASSITATSTPLQFTATASTGTVTLLPFYKMHGQRYTVYWNVTTTNPLPAFVAHYLFNETSGTSAADATGNGKTATLAGERPGSPGAPATRSTSAAARSTWRCPRASSPGPARSASPPGCGWTR
ncbi:hypothetical protein ACFQZ4_51815 [Catellatospora coxensis]